MAPHTVTWIVMIAMAAPLLPAAHAECASSICAELNECAAVLDFGACTPLALPDDGSGDVDASGSASLKCKGSDSCSGSSARSSYTHTYIQYSSSTNGRVYLRLFDGAAQTYVGWCDFDHGKWTGTCGANPGSSAPFADQISSNGGSGWRKVWATG